jgi:outer membrane protein TolC
VSLAQRRAYVELSRRQLESDVRLIKAVGGGWHVDMGSNVSGAAALEGNDLAL